MNKNAHQTCKGNEIMMNSGLADTEPAVE